MNTILSTEARKADKVDPSSRKRMEDAADLRDARKALEQYRMDPESFIALDAVLDRAGLKA